MLKTLSIYSVVLLAGFSAAAEPLATNLTPESAVTTALAENRDLVAARFAIRQADGRLKQAGLWPNALPAKAAADKMKQVEGTVKNIAKLAGDLDESGDAKDQAKTEANLKKLDGLIKVLETQFGMKTADKSSAVIQYTCPMHEEVVQDSPGKCPKCGMKLVAKK